MVFSEPLYPEERVPFMEVSEKVKEVLEKHCPLCGGTNEVLQRPARLMGATYPDNDSWKGDEHFEPCPLCYSQICRIKEM